MDKQNIKTNKMAFFERLEKSPNIAICTAGDLKALNAGVALSLYIAEKFTKKPLVVYTGDLDQVDPLYSDYVEIKNTLSSKTLKIIINYKNTDIENLFWEKDNDEKLILQLGPINRGFSTESIKFETIGADIDVIITVGISNIKNLGAFYDKNKVEIENAFIINIDTSGANTRYGAVNIVYPESDSIISLMLRKFADWKYTPNAVVSSILLYGLNKHVQNDPKNKVEVVSTSSVGI